MQLALELSKEHPTLPRAEVAAALRSLVVKFEEKFSLENFLVVECNDFDARILAERLAMTHSLMNVLGTCGAGENKILKMLSGTDLPIRKNETFCIRARQTRSAVGVDSNRIEKRRKIFKEPEKVLGYVISEQGYRVNLKNPDVTFRLIISDRCIFGVHLADVETSQYEKRRPQHRPFFVPGVILPRVARVLVNLSEVRAGETLLDPFCGTGGILIEAGLVGAVPLGCDIQDRMVEGAKENMKFYGLGANIFLCDAARLDLKDGSIDAVVADPPYGRSAKVGAPSKEKLYEDSLHEILRVLKAGRRAVMLFPSDEFKIPNGFDVEEEHIFRVHRSLTRYIVVMRKAKL